MLKTYTGKYVSTRIDQTNAPLDANVTQVQAWEEFTWIDLGNGMMALQANANGKYVSARTDQTNAPLDANVTQIQAWEQFTWGTPCRILAFFQADCLIPPARIYALT
jgi:glucosylceramidase